MEKIIVRQGETFRRTATTTDVDVDSLTLTVWDEDNNILLEVTGEFIELSTVLDAGIIDIEIGEYNYGYTIEYSDGSVDIQPDASGCDGDCEFPVFEVCEGIPEES